MEFLKRLFVFNIERFNTNSLQYETIATIGVKTPSGERAIQIAQRLELCGSCVTFCDIGVENDVNAMNQYLIAQNNLV